MLSKEEALEIFINSGALMEGHFKLTSGRHSNRFIQCAQLQKYPDLNEKVTANLAEQFKNDNIDIVIGPAMGGIIAAYELAKQLGKPGIFAERENGIMSLRRGFKIKPGQRVLVVEDVITTGGSVKEVIEVVEKSGGIVAGVGVLVDRSGGQVTFGVKQAAVLTLDIASWEAEDCPLCKEGKTEAIKPGSRT